MKTTAYKEYKKKLAEAEDIHALAKVVQEIVAGIGLLRHAEYKELLRRGRRLVLQMAKERMKAEEEAEREAKNGKV